MPDDRCDVSVKRGGAEDVLGSSTSYMINLSRLVIKLVPQGQTKTLACCSVHPFDQVMPRSESMAKKF